VDNLELIRDCLALRQHTLGLFAGALDAPSWVRFVSATQPRALWLLLAAEACATPIRRRVGDAARELPDAQRSLLERASAEELQRMLAARMQLAVIDRAAAAAGVNPIVLKGGVPVAEGKNSFDLGDVDVLLSADECEALASALRDAGGEGILSIRLPHALRTDIHSELDVGAGASTLTPSIQTEPLAGYSRLRRLRNVPNAVYVIQHCTTHHPNRRGNLRDMMLLADALRSCTPDEHRELSDLLDRSSERDLYQRFLTRSLAITRGQTPIEDQRSVLQAAAHYAFSLRWPKAIGPVQYSVRGMATFFFGPASDLARAARVYLFGPVRDHSFWNSHPLTDRLPRLSVIAGYIIRTPYRLALLLYAATLAMAFRLDFDRHLRLPPHTR
jgi:hypothetical protein